MQQLSDYGVLTVQDESEEEDEVEINIRVGSSKSEVAKRGSKVSVAETDMLDALMDNMAM